MNAEGKITSLSSTMRKILSHMNSPQEQKNLMGTLSVIRNSIGKNYEEAVEVWPILFPLVPQEYLGTGELNYKEKALLVTLQLYAIGQQGSNKMMSDESNSIGESLRRIRDERSTALDRRFNTMLTAATFDEFVYHLRQIFKIGKTHHVFNANFPALAEDLFWYQNGRNKQICLKWARDYYRPFLKDENAQA